MINELIIFAIANIKNDEDQIFMTELHANYYNLMYKKALYYAKNQHDAQDIVQNAYVSLIKQISLLKTFKSCILTSYIVFTIENISLNFIKRRDKQSEKMFLYGDDEDIEYVPDTIMPEKIFFEKHGSEILRKAIDQLKPKYRLALYFKYFQKMLDKEIAEIIDIKPGSVREYLTRARNMVRKILETEKEFDLNEIK